MGTITGVFQGILENLKNDPSLVAVIGLLITVLTLIGAFVGWLIANAKAKRLASTSPDAKLKKAEEFLDKGDERRAKELLRQILEDHPDNKTVVSKALVVRAGIYISDKDFNYAIKYANKAIKRNEFNGDAYYILGRAYSLKGEHEKAIQNFDIALKSDIKQEADCYLYRGIEYYVQQDYDNSIKDFNKALEIRPKSVLGLFYRGMAHFNKKDYDRAIADYGQAIRFDPKLALAYNNRGIAYRNKGDYDRAIADYDQAIRLAPNDANAYYNRGTVYGRDKSEYDWAIADYGQAIRLDPNLAEAYYNRGIAYGNKGDYDRAIADHDQAIRLDPNDAVAYFNRGVTYQKIGDTARADADFAKAQELGGIVRRKRSGI
jgi:tetratricopeptide (TPR) repeat protein